MGTEAEWTDPSFAAALDEADPLKAFPGQFYVADPDVCYLDGNSLGRLPLATREVISSFVDDEWGSELVAGWGHWIDEAERVGDLLAKAALGTGPGQTLVADTTSMNLYQLLGALIADNPGRRTIVVDSANFPTDRYVVQGLATRLGLNLITLDVDGSGGPGAVRVAAENELLTPELLDPFLTEDVAVLTLQAVNYRSGARPDIRAITELARSRGIPVVWDCAHAVGSVALDFDAQGVDFAVGCTYKYLNSGPGSPAWLFVRKQWHSRLQVPIQGWFAQEDQFAMGPVFARVDGIRGFQVASPSIVGLRCVATSLAMVAEAGIEQIQSKAAQGTQMMIELVDRWLVPLGCELVTPRDPARRGGHITISHPEAKEIAYAMRVLAKVIPDYREPSSIRLAMSPLATTYTEVWEGIRRVRDLIESKAYLSVAPAQGRVT